MSVYTYTYPYTRAMNGSVWNLDPKQLSPDVELVLPGKPFVVKGVGTEVDVSFADALTAGEETTLDGVVATQQAEGGLSRAKAAKFIAIDANTNRLIANGFSFAGFVFSLSPKAQSTLLGLDASRSDPALTYPIVYNTQDDLDVITLSNATDVHNMFLTALGTYRYWLDTGTFLKNEVRDATTVAEVEAVVDNR